MVYSSRNDILHTTGLVLAADAATFAAAMATTMPALAFAASQDYRFELVQDAAAGSGRSGVTVRLMRAADGKPVADADISANAAVATSIAQAGYRQFRVATATPGPQTLQVSANMPGATRTERTFNSSVKWWQERSVSSKDELVSGVVSFDARRA